jgi:hypothetical protein
MYDIKSVASNNDHLLILFSVCSLAVCGKLPHTLTVLPIYFPQLLEHLGSSC